MNETELLQIFVAFGPYALNVRTNISSYGPRARLIRAYYKPSLLLMKLGVAQHNAKFMTRAPVKF